MGSLLDKLSEVGIDTSYLATKEGTRVGENLVTRDADSHIIEGGNEKGVRIAGVDAPEVQHLTANKGGEFDFDYHGQEQVGGLATHQFANKLTEEEGYDQHYAYQKDRWGPSWLTGTKDEQGVFDRDIGDRRNEEGEFLSSRLIAAGVTPVDRYTQAGSAHHVQSAVGGYQRAQRAAAGEQTEEDMLVAGLAKLKDQSSLDQFGTKLAVKNFAANEDIYGAAKGAGLSHLFAGVEFRDYDKTKSGQVRGWQIDDALKAGTKNGLAGVYTSLGMIGELVGIDSLEAAGYGHTDRLKREIANAPRLRNTQAFDPETGEWTLDGIMDFVDFASVNLASSAPVMLSTMAAVVAAPATGGASLSVPLSIYTGQNYDGQAEDNKNMGTAFGISIFQTALDLIGVKVGGGLIASSVVGTKARKELIKEIATQQNISTGAAENALAQAIKGTMTNAVKLSQEQIERGLRTKAQQATEAGVAFGVDSLVEGGTEALQEVLGVYAEGNNEWEGIQNRLLNSFFAGAVLGGGFSLAGQSSQSFDQYNYQKGQEAESAESASRNALITGYDKGRADTVEARALNDNESYGDVNVEKEGTDTGSLKSLSQLAIDDKEVSPGRIAKTVQGINSLWKNQTQQIFENYNSAGPIMSRLASTLGGNKDRAGATNEEYQQQLSGKYEGKENFDVSILLSRSGFSNATDLNKHINEKLPYYKKIIARSLKLNKDVSEVIGDKHSLAPWEVDLVADLADSDYQATRDNEGSRVNLLAPAFNASSIYSDNAGFSRALQSKGYSKSQADRLAALASSTDAYGSASGVNEYDDVSLDLNDASAVDTSGLTKLAADPAFADYIQKDIFQTIATNSTKAASRVANNKFIGKNGDKIASDLNKAFSRGEITYNQRIQLAKQLQDYVEQLAGTYNFVPHQGYNKGVNIITTYAILNHLGKAALSSMPEWATGRFVDNPSRKSMHDDFKKYAKANAAMVSGYLQDNANSLGITKARENSEINNRGTLRELGYLQDQQSPAARVGGEYSPKQAIWVAEFMKAIGLSQITEAQRGVAAGAAVDNLRHWGLQYAFNKDKGNKLASRARDQLLNLGVNPERAAEINRIESLPPAKDPQEAQAREADLKFLKEPQFKTDVNGNLIQSEASWDDMTKTAIMRQVDTAVAMPRKGNRPKIYNDPRWRLLTLFTGYSSTVTANLLPKIAKNIFGKDRIPAERLDGVKAVAGMIAMAYLAQALKEQIFGQEDWLEEDPGKWYVNLLYQSGLAGTFQRPIDALFPLYGQGNTVTGDAVGAIFPFLQPPLDFVISESPGLSSVDSILDAAAGHLTDDDNKLRSTVKTVPILNSFKDTLAPYKKE